MEPPPPPTPVPSAVIPYPDSVDSSPRSRHTDSWDDSLYPSLTSAAPAATAPAPAAVTKLRLMCSYGGHIVPRPHDKSLCYVGGDTRIVVVDRHTSLTDLTNRLSKTLLHGRSNASSPPQQSFTLKYQLPSEDLDSLISVTTDEDLENMIDEYERLNSGPTTNKSSRLRLFLFPSKPESASSIGSLLENTTKSEDWFLNALNGATSGFSDTSSVNCLLGLDDDALMMPGRMGKDLQAQMESFGGVKGMGSKNSGQDVHSIPDSPMLEATSSFGSASSALANLPPIRVHVEDQKVGGIEEQFSQISVQQKQDDGGFAAMSSPPAVVTPVPMTAQGTVIGDYPNRDRAVSDDERSEQGIQTGYRKPPQQVQQQQPPLMQPQLQQKPSTGFDLASPDSASSDGSITNPLSRQKPPMIFQDQIVRTAATANPVDQNNPDPNSRIQLQQQQIQDSGYLLPTQFDPQQHAQLHQQPQYIHPSSQYIHHHPSGAVPIQSYYQMYPSQQQQQHPHPTAHHSVLDQQNFVYYVPARAPQGYNISMQQPSYNEASATARTQNVAPASAAYNPARNVASSQPELASGVYRTAASGNPQLVQIPSNQHQAQYVGYSQVHHPSQSVAPPPGGAANYGYEFADPSQGHVYYAQPMAPQSTTQYQTMASNLPEAGNLLSSESIKQQVRTSQPQ